MFGENIVEDLAKFHKKINNPLAKMGSYFPLTWQSYIRIVFALNADRKFFNLNKNQQKAEMKKYMENGFANNNGNECLLEIGPLPSPTVAYWNYEKYPVFSDLEELADRKTCMDHHHPKRREKIEALINKKKPKYVFFMSDREQLVNDHWMKIIGSSEEKLIKGFDNYAVGDRPRHFIGKEDINFIICKHPDAQKHLLNKKGVSKHLIECHIHLYYDLIAKYLRQESLLDEKLRHISNEAMHHCLEALRPFVESHLKSFTLIETGKKLRMTLIILKRLEAS